MEQKRSQITGVSETEDIEKGNYNTVQVNVPESKATHFQVESGSCRVRTEPHKGVSL